MKYFLYSFVLIFFGGCYVDNDNITKKNIIGNLSDETILSERQNMELLNKEIRENPDSPNGYFKRYKHYLDIGEIQKAREDINMCINMSPETPIFYQEKAKLLYNLAEFDNCEQYALKSIELDSSAKESHLLLGKIYLAIPNYGMAMDQFNAALRIDKFYHEPYFYKGLTYTRAGDTVNAVSSFITATEQFSDYYEAYVELGILYSNHEGADRNRALLYFDNALQIEPNSIEALLAKGIYLQNNQNLELADSCYNQILNLQSDFEVAYYNKGYIHLLSYQNNWNVEKRDSVLTLAIEDFTSALNINSQYVQSYHNRGVCHELMGDVLSAKVDYSTALKIDPFFALSENALKSLNN